MAQCPMRCSDSCKARSQAHTALAVAFKQMVGHALRAFLTDAGQAAQCFHQLRQQIALAQNGSFSPGGIGIPAVTAAMRLLLSSLTLVTASLMRRYHQIFKHFSICQHARDQCVTLRASILPVRVILTTPPPALPGDFHLGQFFLHFLHVFLHALGFLHHLGDIAFHHGILTSSLMDGWNPERSAHLPKAGR